MRAFFVIALVAAPASAQFVHGKISSPPAQASSTTATSTTSTGSTQTAAQTNNQNSVTPTGAPNLPSAINGVPPTPETAFPGLPVPQASSGLASGVPASPLAQDLRTPVSLTPSQVADMQTRLAAAGFYHGPIDGVLNATTRSGITAFQIAARLPVTGQPDGVTAGTIGIASPAAAAATFGTPFALSPINQPTVFIQP